MTVRTLLFAGLTVASASACADTLTATINSSVNLYDVAIAYRSPDGSDMGVFPIHDIPAGTYTYSGDVPGSAAQYQNYSVSLLSTYSDGTNSGVVVAMNPTAASAADGKDFATVFSGASETGISSDLGALQQGGINGFFAALDLGTFTSTNYSQYASIGTGATLEGFTGGHNVGSVTFNVAAVPEPATMAALGLGAVAFIRRRRK